MCEYVCACFYQARKKGLRWEGGVYRKPTWRNFRFRREGGRKEAGRRWGGNQLERRPQLSGSWTETEGRSQAPSDLADQNLLSCG